jgi:hypothetical protein
MSIQAGPARLVENIVSLAWRPDLAAYYMLTC